MSNISFKIAFIFIIVIFLTKSGFSQPKIAMGVIVGTGFTNLSLGYTTPNITLGGVHLLKPISLGLYGEYTVTKQFKAGLDVTYYRLPLEVSDGRGNITFLEKFTYLNIAPFIAYEPVKWVAIAFNFSVRPLLSYTPREFPPSATLLSYYGPRLTIKPIKQLGIDFGYETYSRPFATTSIIGGPVSLANTTLYTNIRFTIVSK